MLVTIFFGLGNVCGWSISQFDATRAYALSKLANVLHTKELSSRLQVSFSPSSLSLTLIFILQLISLSPPPPKINNSN